MTERDRAKYEEPGEIESESRKANINMGTWKNVPTLDEKASYVAPLTRWQDTIKGVNGIKNMRCT